MSEENVEIVRKALAAVDRRDVDAFLADVDPDVVTDWSRAIGPERSVLRGSGELVRFLRSWWSAFEESVVVLDEVIDAGEHVVVAFHGRQRGRGSGAIVEGRGSVLVFGLREGSVITATLYQGRRGGPCGARDTARRSERTSTGAPPGSTTGLATSGRAGRADRAQTERDKARDQRRAAEAEDRQDLQGRESD